MTRKTLLLLGCMALTAPYLAPALSPAMAQSQTGLGFDVTKVEVSVDGQAETFRNVQKLQWERSDSSGQIIARYSEAGRDEWSVYLSDTTDPKLFVQLDLFTKKVIQQPRGGATVQIGTVVANSTAPLTSAPAGRGAISSLPVVSQKAAQAPATPATADDFDPFADPADPAPDPGSVVTPKTNRDIINAASQRPAFTQRNDGSGQVAAATKGPSFDGQWVAEGEIAKEKGDGVSTAVTWTFREALWITTAPDDTMTIHFDARPTGSITLRKAGEGQYSGSGYTASFAIIDKKNIRLNLVGGGTSREYGISTVPSGAKLSRSRIQPETDDEIDTFTAGNLVPRFNDMFLSYRGEKMDLFNANRGAGPRIFKAPGTQDFSIESNLQSKTIPYGLRGQEIRRTEGNQLESVITNMASFEKSMSLNFGVSGSFKGATFAAEASREESKGAERTDGTTKAYGLARAEIYALFLDKPNMLLDPGFKFDILRLADGALTAQAFRTKYGTHYANAIHYGGIGKNQRTVTTEEFKKWSKESTSYKQEGGFDGGPVGSLKSKGGLTIASGDAKGGTSMFSKETWSSVGGSGSMTSNGWNVDERNSVPIRYDLRPLSELISPIFFGEEWSSPKRAGLLNARSQLDAEITSYLQSQPKADDRTLGPIIYRLKFHSLVCVNNGDNEKEDVELYGNITASVHGLEGFQEVILLDASEDNMASFSCSGRKEFPINREVLVAGNRNPKGAGQGSFKIVATGVKENDPSAVLIDDPIMVWPASSGFDAYIYMKDWNAKQPRTDIEGTAITNAPGLTEGPDIRVKVSFEAIQ